ncbi:MAG: adenylyltransferase/cytidyltransferase family protein [Bacteroidetes bacterium]|nr:adenylyltransferase/cytidyltransferase family protein [Bacteroidota bacterium]MCH8524873.1 adenylyltransferase/cytidyltransferase family protein [Balneolales bacterium]
MKRVLTVGVFDLYHFGHLKVLEMARKQGDYLITAVHDDVLMSKGYPFFYSLEQRMEIVSSCRWVDEVVPYMSVDTIVKEINFDVFAHGPDQNHVLFQRAISWCRANGKDVICLPRTEGISSTQIRKLAAIG